MGPRVRAERGERPLAINTKVKAVNYASTRERYFSRTKVKALFKSGLWWAGGSVTYTIQPVDSQLSISQRRKKVVTHLVHTVTVHGAVGRAEVVRRTTSVLRGLSRGPGAGASWEVQGP